MVRKTKTKSSRSVSDREEVSGRPSFPYCTVPKSLRRFLEMAPDKPRPPKINTSTLRVWGLKSGNDTTILRVLKALDFLGANGETTQTYADFMRKDTGPSTLGRKIKSVYSTLFENVSKPETASNSELTNFFNIHSGGGEATIKFQIDTFKALAAFATFGQSDPLEQPEIAADPTTVTSKDTREREPIVRVDLHITCPKTKTKVIMMQS